jgi:hypothetical protein
VFLHVFSKSSKSSLTKEELAEYSKAAQAFARLSARELNALRATRGWREFDV